MRRTMNRYSATFEFFNVMEKKTFVRILSVNLDSQSQVHKIFPMGSVS